MKLYYCSHQFLMRKMYAPYAICHVHDFNWTYHLRRPTPKPYNNNNRSNNSVDHTVETISCCPLDYSHSILLVRMVFIIVCWKAIEYQHCERITPLNGTDTTDFFCYFFLSEHHRRFFCFFLGLCKWTTTKCKQHYRRKWMAKAQTAQRHCMVCNMKP